MKNSHGFLLCILTTILLSGCSGQKNDPYYFNGKISEEVLNNYLSRAVTMSEFLTVDPFCNDGVYPDKEADIEFIHNTGAKFIGRSIYRWGDEAVLNEPEFWEGARNLIDKVHDFDPDVIFQAGVFEAVYKEVEKIEIPEWTFKALGLPVEKRHFQYGNMLFKDGKFVDLWGPGGSVPDIKQVETQLWFMFLIGSYVEIGIESIHLGQVMLIGADDTGWTVWGSFLDKVRSYVNTKARRNFVMFDAHAGSKGMMIGENSLLDFNAFPLRIKEIPEEPMKGMLELGHLDAIYRKSPGCITPSGWRCASLPYLVEFDNFGISDHPGEANINDHYIWGYDEISWLYQLDETYRKEWIRYAFDWLKENDPAGHLEMPGARVVSLSDRSSFMCRAVAKTDSVPTGMNLEETIKEIWNE